MRSYTLHIAALLLLLSLSCRKENPIVTDPPGGGGPGQGILPAYFDHPAWHPAGEWIAAEHSDSLDTDGDDTLDYRFSGIWLVHAETGETEPLIEGYGLPAWSPDGTRLAMGRGGQIFTITVTSLDPVQVDNGSFTQLTSEGRNFYPAWSSDANWIAYDNSDCGGTFDPPPANSCGVLALNLHTMDKRFISLYSRMPCWSPIEQKILMINRAVISSGEILGDTIWIFSFTSGKREFFTFLTGVNYDNQHLKYSPNAERVGFFSKPKLGGGNLGNG